MSVVPVVVGAFAAAPLVGAPRWPYSQSMVTWLSSWRAAMVLLAVTLLSMGGCTVPGAHATGSG